MGGFSSKSTPSAASESHGILKAIIYSVLFHQNLVAQGRAAPVVMPQLPKPDPKPKPAPPPQIVQIKVPVPPKPTVPAPTPAQPGAPAPAQPGASAPAQPGGAPAPARPGGTPAPAPATPATPGTAGDPQAEAAKRRAEQRDREARGRSATLATSWRGVLTPLGRIGGRKTLLGE